MTSFDAWCRAGVRNLSLHARKVQEQPLRSQLAAISGVKFSAGYDLALKLGLLRGVGFGPVDIASHDMSGLLARYIADVQEVDWDSLHQRLGALRAPDTRAVALRATRLATRIRYMKRGNAKARAQRRISAHLVWLGLAPLRCVCVTWPAALPMWIFRQLMCSMKRQTVAVGNAHAAWLASLAQPVRGRRRTFADRWRFISVARGFGTLLAACKLQRVRPTAAECKRTRRVKLHWRIPVWQSRQDIVREAYGSLSWLAHKMSCDIPHTACERLFASHLHLSRPSSMYVEYESRLPVCSSCEVLVQEDKDKNAAWVMPILVYEKWCFWLFRQDTVHWTPVFACARAVCEEYRQLHLQVLPVHLRRWASKRRWEGFELPYAYCTLKAKCFAVQDVDGCTEHVCQKPGHSCFRRIISWRSHPARNMYKGVGRALLGLISLLGVGFETANLFSAVEDFRAAVSKLACDSLVCVRCCSPKPLLSICVCDAAQMYEELHPEKIREAVAFLISRIRQLKPEAKGIAVAKSKRLHTRLTFSDFGYKSNCTVWTWSDISVVLDLALQQPIVRLGKALFRQDLGAPIGGHLSKAIASAVLAFAELRACESLDLSKSAGYVARQATSIGESVACTRYVDDLAMGSRTLCPTCLHCLTQLVYPKPICFDPTLPDGFGVRWLDVWLQGDSGSLVVRVDGVEHAWMASAGAGLPQKFRIKPWLGDQHTDFSEMRGIAAGKLTRLKSLKLEAQQLRAAVRNEICIWVLSGYPAKALRRIWGSLPHFPEASSIATDMLTRWMHSALPQRILAGWFH